MNLYYIVNLVFEVLYILIIIRCVLSFIRHDPYNPLIKLVYQLTEPLLSPFRKLMRPGMGIDFSPILAFLVLQILERVIFELIRGF
ncbi:MAG: YggT family protein [Firmicutes bacterium]|nr:YggT family protein [Bacillota bacterium]